MCVNEEHMRFDTWNHLLDNLKAVAPRDGASEFVIKSENLEREEVSDKARNGHVHGFVSSTRVFIGRAAETQEKAKKGKRGKEAS